MAGSDRRGIAVVLDAVRRVALDIESATSIVPLPKGAPPPAPQDPDGLYDAMVTNADLRANTRKLFRDGHYAQAVEQACKLLNNSVKARCGSTKDGPDLMHHAFGGSTPPLRINRLKTESHRAEQEGYRFMFAGVMSGLRNPRAHEHLLRDEPETALEMLIIANHLMATLARATRTRRRRSTTLAP